MRRETSLSNCQPECQPVTGPDRLLLAAYWGHLLVPLVLVADSLRVVHAHTANISEKGVVVVGSIWLVAGLGALALSRNRRHFLQRISGPLLAAYAFYFSVALAELGLRVMIPSFNRNTFRFRPGTVTVTHNLARWGLPGVPPTATFTTNRLGLRGPLPPSDGRVYKIITVGGSTTACAALDDSQDWSHLLMVAMNEGQKKHPVWVGNSGAGGLTTVDHLACLRYRPVLSQADLLIFLIGVNDLQATLTFRGASSQKHCDFRARALIAHAPHSVKDEGGLFRRSWLFAMARDVAWNALTPLRYGPSALETDPVLGSREARAAGPIVPLPDLQLGRREYAQRVRELERECRRRGLRCIFLTQPTLWRADLSPVEEHLLWSGLVGREGYASAADLASAMDAFNQTLLSVCREDNLECYDLASAIPKDTSAFYDEDHFNIGGARMVAQFLAARLLASPPFSGTAP